MLDSNVLVLSSDLEKTSFVTLLSTRYLYPWPGASNNSFSNWSISSKDDRITSLSLNPKAASFMRMICLQRLALLLDDAPDEVRSGRTSS